MFSDSFRLKLLLELDNIILNRSFGGIMLSLVSASRGLQVLLWKDTMGLFGGSFAGDGGLRRSDDDICFPPVRYVGGDDGVTGRWNGVKAKRLSSVTAVSCWHLVTSL